LFCIDSFAIRNILAVAWSITAIQNLETKGVIITMATKKAAKKKAAPKKKKK